MDKLKALGLETGKQFFLAKKKKHVVKDLDLRRRALTAKQTCDRKITKFVTEKSIKEQSAADCVALLPARIADY
ncbi:hypothetical protein RvY_08622 [Ramazzottius varieornatus]|uniref:Uncharacterized protein n=1 Tax=Ramazzottius varieornatus TaxID=947166 RepID=A0A1D1V6J3_RAMVA|nr:hypothetical protein RvY_08622 [Ramazzottius varieornatus]